MDKLDIIIILIGISAAFYFIFRYIDSRRKGESPAVLTAEEGKQLIQAGTQFFTLDQLEQFADFFIKALETSKVFTPDTFDITSTDVQTNLKILVDLINEMQEGQVEIVVTTSEGDKTTVAKTTKNQDGQVTMNYDPNKIRPTVG